MFRLLNCIAVTAILAQFLLPEPAWAENYRAKAIAYFADDLKSSSAGVDKAHVDLQLIDLNGDGIPEALAVLTGGTACGSHGCMAEVLDLSGPTARSIGSVIAFDLRPLRTKTNGWTDVAFNSSKASAKLVHRGKGYDFNRSN